MKLKEHIQVAMLAALLLASRTTAAQTAVTKSGTPITPAARQPINEMPKQSAPLPLPEARPVYVAVCPADLSAALQPLLQWRRQQGYRVELICPTTHKRDSIRQLLAQRYHEASPLRPAQRYVLLAGDVDRIQAFIGKHTPNGLNSSVTDLYYGEYTGDYLPEAAVGRLPATDSAELTLMVAKIIDYEQGLRASRQRQLLLAAGKENSAMARTTTNGQVHYLAQMAAEHLPDLDTICFYNPATDSLRDHLTAALDRGNALVNYTGHCTRAGWSYPNVNALGIDTLLHDMPSIYVNNCCLSNAFDGTCFGEQLLRTADGGAAAAIGATNETLWHEDFYWAVGAQYPPTLHPAHDSIHPGAFNGLMAPRPNEPDYARTLGGLLHAGCRAVSQSGSVYDAFYWETYCLLGDPATAPFMGTADTLALALLDTLHAGATCLHLSATPGCLITALSDTLLLGCTTADSNGEAWMPLAPALTTDTLLLTATRHDARPSTLRIAAEPATDARLAVTGLLLDGQTSPTLAVRIKNISNQHACKHLMTLWQDSADYTNSFKTDTCTSTEIGLAAGADTLLNLNLGQLAPGQLALLRAHLTLSDSNNHAYNTMKFVLEVSDQRPMVTDIQLLDSNGQAVRRLMPGTHVWVAYTLSAEADSVVWGGEGIAWDGEERFTVTDDSTAHLRVTPYKHSWYQTFDYYFTCHESVEDFEHGLSHYPWETNSLFPWVLDSTERHHGIYSLRSGPAGDNLKSEIVLQINAVHEDSIYFWLNVSSEAGDYLNFYVDGKRRGWWSGNTGWQHWGCPIAAGSHQLRWSYQKNALRTERSDCARIDQVQLPFCSWDAPYGISSGQRCTAIPAKESQARLDIYPNPSNGEVTIAIESANHARTLALFDPLGRMTEKIFLAPSCNSIQYFTAQLRYSIYTIILYDEHQQPIAIRKMIVTAK